jgi:hypothetical protein
VVVVKKSAAPFSHTRNLEISKSSIFHFVYLYLMSCLFVCSSACLIIHLYNLKSFLVSPLCLLNHLYISKYSFLLVHLSVWQFISKFKICIFINANSYVNLSVRFKLLYLSLVFFKAYFNISNSSLSLSWFYSPSVKSISFTSLHIFYLEIKTLLSLSDRKVSFVFDYF